MQHLHMRKTSWDEQLTSPRRARAPKPLCKGCSFRNVRRASTVMTAFNDLLGVLEKQEFRLPLHRKIWQSLDSFLVTPSAAPLLPNFWGCLEFFLLAPLPHFYAQGHVKCSKEHPPKSPSLVNPWLSMNTFSGLRSRYTMWLRCR